MAMHAQALQTLHKLLLSPANPRDALARLEEPCAVRSQPRTDPSQEAEQRKVVERVARLMARPEEDQGDSGVKVPNLAEELALLHWAGVGLGCDAHRLFLSIKKLSEAVDGEVGALRFWGRISTLGRPYFVVEGGNPEEPEDLDPTLQEGREGVNRLAYWVSQSLEADPKSWAQLPMASVAQVVASARVRRFLTGDLTASVACHPPFPGSEAALLRAQIARITGDTNISPVGYFKLEDEDAPDTSAVLPCEAEEVRERVPRSAMRLCAVDAWTHHEKQLNALGRLTAPPTSDEEDSPPPTPDAPPVPRPLEPIDPALWTLRRAPGCAGSSQSSAVVARSLRWPGACVVASPDRYVCAYVGSGLKGDAGRVCPALPLPQVREEAPDAFEEERDLTEDPTPPAPEEPEQLEGGDDDE